MLAKFAAVAAVSVVATALLGGSGPTRATAATATSASARAVADFNGDGFPDVAIGAPGVNSGAGAVYVLYGSASGVSTSSSQLWSLDSPGVNGVAAAGDGLGTAVTAGDFNHDGFSDLAIAAPAKNHVLVLYGSATGLQASGNQYFRANGPTALAAGDFNGDHYADLAVGEPFANAKQPAAGSIEIHYGSASGLTALAARTAPRFTEASAGMPGPRPSPNDNFGLSLAVGNYNGDSFDDLSVGAPNGNSPAGAVTVLYGSRHGITTKHSQFIAVFGDAGGFAQTSGDFNGDGVDDLIIGAPNTATSASNAGAIEIHYGSGSGLTKTAPGTAPVIAEATVGMPGPGTAANDFFGFSLTTGDFNGDRIDDVAIGVPGKSAAIVLRGSAKGIVISNGQFVQGVGPQPSGVFAATGVAVSAADFNRDGFDDLVLGEPFTTENGQSSAGVVELFAGSSAGVTNTSGGTAPQFSESSSGLPGTGAATDDDFGFSLATTRASN